MSAHRPRRPAAAANLALEQLVRSWEQDARDEAGRLWRQHTYLPRLVRLVDDARVAVGGDLRSHGVRVDPGRWPADIATLLRGRVRDGLLSRGAVIDAGARDGRGWSLFVLSYVWGWGRRGYGPARLSRIRTATTDDAIRAVLDEALADLDTLGPIAAYKRLRGAVPGWGPAFFTKWLYFADQVGGRGRALILNKKVAIRLQELTQMPCLVDSQRRSRRWTAYRYAVYLAWAHGAADQVSEATRSPVPADLVELALFRR